jgi:hypothetical protein
MTIDVRKDIRVISRCCPSYAASRGLPAAEQCLPGGQRAIGARGWWADPARRHTSELPVVESYRAAPAGRDPRRYVPLQFEVRLAEVVTSVEPPLVRHGTQGLPRQQEARWGSRGCRRWLGRAAGFRTAEFSRLRTARHAQFPGAPTNMEFRGAVPGRRGELHCDAPWREPPAQRNDLHLRGSTPGACELVPSDVRFTRDLGQTKKPGRRAVQRFSRFAMTG